MQASQGAANWQVFQGDKSQFGAAPPTVVPPTFPNYPAEAPLIDLGMCVSVCVCVWGGGGVGGGGGGGGGCEWCVEGSGGRRGPPAAARRAPPPPPPAPPPP